MWTPEKLSLCRTLAKEGKSASQIAAVLGDKSRCAIIGKLHREGITLPRKSSPRGSVERRLPAERGRRTVDATHLERLRAMAAARSKAAREVSGVSFVDLESHHCRWPLGEEIVTYCGLEKFEGTSYCPEHELLSRRTQRET